MVLARLAIAAGRALGGSESFALVRVFVFYLPVLTYCLLAAIWMMSMTQGAMRRRDLRTHSSHLGDLDPDSRRTPGIVCARLPPRALARSALDS